MFWTPAPLLVFICLLVFTGTTYGHEHGPGVVRVVEGNDAILPCSLSPKEDIVQKLFDWRKDGQKEVFLYDAGIHYNNGRPGQDEQFKGRVSHFQEQLKYGNASIIIRDTKIEDRGNYTCAFPLLQPEEKIFNVELIVELILKDRSREISGAAPPPYIRIFTAPEDGVLLQCEVRGAFPKPKVEWQSSDGSILPAEEPHVSERGGRYDVTLRTTVTKTTSSHLHCVATQEDIGHVTHAEITVSFSESTQWIPGILVGIVIGIVIGISLTVVAVKHCEMCQKYSNSYKGSWQQKNGLPKENGSPEERLILPTCDVVNERFDPQAKGLYSCPSDCDCHLYI